MKYRYFGLLLCAAFLALPAGCQKGLEEKTGGDGEVDGFSGLTATINKDDLTKTFLTSDDYIGWIPGEKVRATGAGTSKSDLTLVCSYGSTVASLTGSTPTARTSGSKYWAFYPTGIVSSVVGGDPVLVLPETRSADYLASPLAWNPMFAMDDSWNLDFKNLCGLLELTIKGTGIIKKIELQAMDETSSYMSGNFTIGSSGQAVITDDASASRKAIMTFTHNVAISIAGKKFYIALPEGTYKNVVLRLFDSNDAISSTKVSSFTVKRGYVYGSTVNNPSFHAAVQLWKDGPYFATMNVGAADIYKPGTFYSWGSYTTIYSADTWTSQSTAAGTLTVISPYTTGFSATTVTALGLDSKYSSATTLTIAAGTDPVNKLWGAGWHLPTIEEWETLIANTTRTLEKGTATLHTGYDVWIVTGKGDFSTKSIYMPNTSYTSGTSHVANNTDRVLLWSNENKTIATGGATPYIHALEINTSNFGFIPTWKNTDCKNWGWPYRAITY